MVYIKRKDSNIINEWWEAPTKEESELYSIEVYKGEVERCNYDGFLYVKGTAPDYSDTVSFENSKNNLSAGDYKIIKCFEAYMIGEALPYDIEKLVKERNEYRKVINDIEAKEKEKGNNENV